VTLSYPFVDHSSTAETPAPFDDEAAIERYRDAAIALLPPGKAIAKRLGSNIARLFEGVAVELARIEELASIVRRNAVPSQASEMLEEWEEALGLPGSCVSTPSTSASERAGAVVAKLRGRTSHAQSAYDSAALDLGYEDLEYERYEPFEVGASSVGDHLYGDGWVNVVQISVPVGDQTADEELECIFTDQLRRSHGYLDIALEGPMGATRTHYADYHNDITLSATILPADLTGLVELKYNGFLSAQVVIGANTSTPVGVWKLYASSNGVDFSEVVNATVTAQLALIAPNGNNAVSAFAVFTDLPGQYVKLAYTRTSGGGGDCLCSVHLTTW